MENGKGISFHGISIEKGDVRLYSEGLPEEILGAITQYGCIVPPVNMRNLAKLAISDPTHRACIDLKVMMTVGLGYKFLSKKANKDKKFKDFAKTPTQNIFKTLHDVFYALALDYYIFENAALELVKLRDNDYGLHHLGAKNFYVKPKKIGKGLVPGLAEKYYQIVGGYSTDFNVLEKGKKMDSGKHYAAHLYNYSPNSSYYGMPSYLSATPNISENVLIREHGIRFFSNSARPDLALLISNGDITDEEVRKVKEQLSDYHKGVENSHRFFIFSIEGENAKVELKEVSKTIDGQFLKESEKNRDEIARIHKVPPKILGISSAGSLGSGSETIGALKTFVETCINPEQKRFENFINRVLEAMFGYDPEIQFQKIDLTNKKDDAIIATMLSKIVDINGKAAMTVDEIRESNNMPIDAQGEKMASASTSGSNSLDAVNQAGKPRVGVNIDQQSKIETLDEENPNPKED